VAQAQARIAWLENIITQNLPSIDLAAGPTADLKFAVESYNTIQEVAFEGNSATDRASDTSDNTLSPQTSRSNKRGHSLVTDSDRDESFHAKARSVAHDLGRLSLNADSQEKRYLGSSSGLMFSYLLRPGGPTSEESQNGKSQLGALTNHEADYEYAPIYEALVSVCASNPLIWYND